MFIEKDGTGFVKCDAVLSAILQGLLRVPLEAKIGHAVNVRTMYIFRNTGGEVRWRKSTTSRGLGAAVQTCRLLSRVRLITARP